jgi:hypothetical protein
MNNSQFIVQRLPGARFDSSQGEQWITICRFTWYDNDAVGKIAALLDAKNKFDELVRLDQTSQYQIVEQKVIANWTPTKEYVQSIKKNDLDKKLNEFVEICILPWVDKQ